MRALGERGLEDRQQLVAVAVAVGEAREARVGGEVLAAQHAAQPSQNFCLAQATVIHPSAVAKAWKGTIDGCAECGMRRGCQPSVAAHVPT